MDAPSTAGSGPRPYLARAERRAMLLASARAIVAAEGAEALSMRSLAQHAGVAHGSVQHAFGTKVELVAALLEDEARDVLARVWRRTSAGRGDLGSLVEAALLALVDDLVEHAAQHAALAHLERAALATRGVRPALIAQRAALREAIAALVDAWCGDRGVRVDDPGVVVDALVVAIDGVSASWLVDGDAARLRAVVPVLAAGIAAAAGDAG